MYVEIQMDYSEKNIGTYVSSTFHSAVVKACQPEMLVMLYEMTNTYFWLELHAYG